MVIFLIHILFVFLPNAIAGANPPDADFDFGRLEAQPWAVCDSKLMDAVENELVTQLCLRALDPVCLTEVFKGKNAVPVPLVSKDGQMGVVDQDNIKALTDPKRLIPAAKRKEILKKWESGRLAPPSGDSKSVACNESRAWLGKSKKESSVNYQKALSAVVGQVAGMIGQEIIKNLPGGHTVLSMVQGVLGAFEEKIETPEALLKGTNCDTHNGSLIYAEMVQLPGSADKQCTPVYKLSQGAVDLVRQKPDVQAKFLKNKELCTYYNGLLANLQSSNDMTSRMMLQADVVNGPSCAGKGRVDLTIKVEQGVVTKDIQVTSALEAKPASITLSNSSPAYPGSNGPGSTDKDVTISEYKIEYVDKGAGVLCENPKLTGENYFEKDDSLQGFRNAHAAGVMLSAATSACCEKQPADHCIEKYAKSTKPQKRIGNEPISVSH